MSPADSHAIERQHARVGLIVSSLGSPAGFVFVIALIGGLVFAAIVPPLKGADERDHLARAYQLATGQLGAYRSGGYWGARLPSGYQSYMGELTRVVYDNPDHTAFAHEITHGTATGKPVFVEEGTIASYGPGAYLPYLPALALGYGVGIPLGIQLYLARASGVLAYSAVLALAVRRIPRYKWVMVASGLVPEALNQASTVSADGLTTALTFLLVAWFIRMAVAGPTLTGRHKAEIVAASAVLALAKPPYVLVVLLLPALAAYRRRPLRTMMGFEIPLAGASLALSAVWLWYHQDHSSRLDLPGLLITQAAPNLYEYRDIHTGAQLAGLMKAPWQIVELAYHTITYQGWSFPGQLLGLLALYQIPWWLVALSAVTLVAALSIDWRRHEISAIDGALLLVATAVVAIAVSITVYIAADALGAPRIDGLTPRYFLPLIPGSLIAVASLANLLRRPLQLSRSSFRDRYQAHYVAVVQALIVLVLVLTAVLMAHFYFAGASRGP